MKKFLKKAIGLMLSVCIMVNLCALTSFAMERKPVVDLSQYDAQSVQMLRELHVYSDEDIALILEYDQTHPARNALARVTYPSNPKEGDYFYKTYTVTRTQLDIANATAVEVALALANITGIPAILLAGVAAIILDGFLNDNNINGVKLTVKYTYGVTDDLTMGWTQTLHNYEFI